MKATALPNGAKTVHNLWRLQGAPLPVRGAPLGGPNSHDRGIWQAIGSRLARKRHGRYTQRLASDSSTGRSKWQGIQKKVWRNPVLVDKFFSDFSSSGFTHVDD